MINSQYVIVGRMLKKRHPELAMQLLKEAEQEKIEAATEDYSLLPEIFKKFCKAIDIEASMILGEISKNGGLVRADRERSKLRALFIGLAVKIYDPEILANIRTGKLKIGLRSAIAQTLNMNESKVSAVVSNAICWCKINKGEMKQYADQVEELYKQIFNENKAA